MITRTGEASTPRAMALNAAAALYVAGVAVDIAEGLARARQAIDSGAARQALARYVETTRDLAAEAA